MSTDVALATRGQVPRVPTPGSTVVISPLGDEDELAAACRVWCASLPVISPEPAAWVMYRGRIGEGVVLLANRNKPFAEAAPTRVG